MTGYLVNSSNLYSLAYNAWGRTLLIGFRNGNLYEYYRVPGEVWRGLLAANSQG